MKADAFGQTPGIVATLQDAHEFALRMLPCDRQHHFGQRGEIFAFQSQRADRILAMRVKACGNEDQLRANLVGEAGELVAKMSQKVMS